jgi:hypothetical protein
MPENRKEAEMYLQKLHEMLPDLKEKYHVSYLGGLWVIYSGRTEAWK